MAQEIDKRAEGAYVSMEVVGLYATKLFTIERVNGDQSVSKVGLTEDEAKVVVDRLIDGLVYEPELDEVK
jgi:hypothetical protein